jgi:hypothetical protein
VSESNSTEKGARDAIFTAKVIAEELHTLRRLLQTDELKERCMDAEADVSVIRSALARYNRESPREPVTTFPTQSASSAAVRTVSGADASAMKPTATMSSTETAIIAAFHQTRVAMPRLAVFSEVSYLASLVLFLAVGIIRLFSHSTVFADFGMALNIASIAVPMLVILTAINNRLVSMALSPFEAIDDTPMPKSGQPQKETP